MKKVEYSFHKDWVPLAMKNLFLEEWGTDNRDILVEHEEPVETYDRIKSLYDKGYLEEYVRYQVELLSNPEYDILEEGRQSNIDFKNKHDEVSYDDIYCMGRVFWEYQDLLPYKIV